MQECHDWSKRGFVLGIFVCWGMDVMGLLTVRDDCMSVTGGELDAWI